MSKLPRGQRGRLSGGGLLRGWGLHQSADRGGENGSDPLGNALAKHQKMASEEGGSQENSQVHGEDKAE